MLKKASSWGKRASKRLRGQAAQVLRLAQGRPLDKACGERSRTAKDRQDRFAHPARHTVGVTVLGVPRLP